MGHTRWVLYISNSGGVSYSNWPSQDYGIEYTIGEFQESSWDGPHLLGDIEYKLTVF